MINDKAKQKAKDRNEEIGFIEKNGLCPFCGEIINVMSSTFALRKNLRVCKKCDKYWNLHGVEDLVW